MTRNVTVKVVWRSLSLAVIVFSLLRPTHQSRILLGDPSCQVTVLADMLLGNAKAAAGPPGPVWMVNEVDGKQWSLGSAASPSLCAGSTYSLTARFSDMDGAPQNSWALLAASLGSWGSGGSGGAAASGGDFVRVNPVCTNRVVLGASSEPPLASFPADESKMFSSYNLTLSLPCEAAGTHLVLMSWSGCAVGSCGTAAGIARSFNLTVPVNSSCSSAAAICGPPPPSPTPTVPTPMSAPQQLPSPAAVVVRRSARPPTFPPQPVAPPAACQPSLLNYTCSMSLGRVVLHWTIGGAAPPPNRCTGPQPRSLLLPAAGEAAKVSASNSSLEQRLVHFAMEAAVSGYVSLGFPEAPEKMYNADVVLGWVDASNVGVINAYYITAAYVSSNNVVSQSWALGATVVQDVYGGGGPRTTICFSRAVREPAAKSSPLLDPTALKYSWAVSNRDALSLHAAGDFGAGVIDLTTATSTPEPSDTGRRRAAIILAHGVLMSVAWVLLMPLGAMAPAHRWLFPAREIAGLQVWFWVHITAVLSGLLLFVVGFALALKCLAGAPPPDGSLHSAHAIMGYLVAGLTGLQLLSVSLKRFLGNIQPPPQQQQQDPPPTPQQQQKEQERQRRNAWTRRYLWNPFHKNCGRAAILVAWVVVLTGIRLHQESVFQTPVVPWVVPIAVCMGLLLLANGWLLDIQKDAAAAALAAVSLSSLSSAAAAEMATMTSSPPPQAAIRTTTTTTTWGMDGMLLPQSGVATAAAHVSVGVLGGGQPASQKGEP